MKYSHNSFGRSCAALASGLGIMLIISACNAPGSSSSGTMGSSSATTVTPGGTPGGGTAPAPVTQVAVATVTQQTMNLGVSLTVPVTIQSKNGYAGPVTLSINNTVLAANDPMKTMTVTIAPASVTLTAGGTATASVSIVSTSASPDLNTFVDVVATTPNGAVTGQVPLQVNAVFEVDILSAGNLDTTGIEDWTIPGATTTNFTQHVKGITIMFCNKDTVEKSGFYRIHSSATAFLHEGTEGLGLPGTQTPNVNDGTAANSSLIASTLGPCYTVDVLSQVAQLKDLYYDHNNENEGKAGRTMVFNAYTAPTVIGKSGNPNASFAYLQKNMFNTTMCMSCHITSPATLGNNINFSTYAGVLTQVDPGSALGSPLYVQIAAGGTMPQNDPGSVSSTLVQDTEDWINDGALNN